MKLAGKQCGGDTSLDETFSRTREVGPRLQWRICNLASEAGVMEVLPGLVYIRLAMSSGVVQEWRCGETLAVCIYDVFDVFSSWIAFDIPIRSWYTHPVTDDLAPFIRIMRAYLSFGFAFQSVYIVAFLGRQNRYETASSLLVSFPHLDYLLVLLIEALLVYKNP